ncbi:MAG: hypothetical protein R2813_12955 [Flavobacteriales bacterium]
MKHVTTLTLAIITLSQFSLGQVQQNQSEKPYIEVTGHADKKIVPDEIYLSITIKEERNR